MRGIHRWPVNSPHKWPVTRNIFPFDDVIMQPKDHPSRCNSGQWAVMHGLPWPTRPCRLLSFFSVVSRDTCRDHFVYVPSQWETTLHCNVVSHWLGTYTKWSLYMVASRHDNTFLITGPSWGNPPVPYKRPVMPTIVVSPKEPMNKQSRCRWF